MPAACRPAAVPPATGAPEQSALVNSATDTPAGALPSTRGLCSFAGDGGDVPVRTGGGESTSTKRTLLLAESAIRMSLLGRIATPIGRLNCARVAGPPS